MKMSDDELAKIRKACPVKLVRGDDTAFKLVVDSSPECKDVIKDIYDNAGPDTRKYITRRIETSDPELKKIIDKKDE
jgi:hypothetical protein